MALLWGNFPQSTNNVTRSVNKKAKNNIEWNLIISANWSNVLRCRTTIPPSALMTICHALLLYVCRFVMRWCCVIGIHEHCVNLGTRCRSCCTLLYFVVCYCQFNTTIYNVMKIYTFTFGTTSVSAHGWNAAKIYFAYLYRHGIQFTVTTK